MRIPFFITLFLISCTVLAQNQVSITPQEQAFYDKAMSVIKKEYKNLVVQTAGQLKGRSINPDSLIRVMKESKMLANLNSTDIEALTFLVLMEASKSSQEDLKSIMDQTKEINKNKENLRTSNQTVAATKKDSSIHLIKNKHMIIQTKKDSLTDMNQMTQLRLQMAMDRRSKIMTSLSNILKKISDTQDQIISNLK